MKQLNSQASSVALTVPLQLLCQLTVTALCSAMVILLAGCSRRYDDVPAYSPFMFKDYDNSSVGRFKTSFIAEQIDQYYRGANPGPIAVATFVNLDDLYHSSSFGRMLSEQVMSELAMRGFEVIELRHSDALQFLESAGELALSRDIRAVRHERQLGGVIVGTYVVSPVRVYVNTRLVDPSTSMILSAGSVEMAKTGEIQRLLRGGGTGPTLERIPVRHLGFSSYPATGFPSQMGQMWNLEESNPSPMITNVVPAPKKSVSLTPVEPKLPEIGKK